MNIRKALIRLNNNLESSWSLVDFSEQSRGIDAGWYVAEFICEGLLEIAPKLVIETKDGELETRQFIGAHSGRNRLIIYLPAGTMLGHSQSMKVERLARVPLIEARFRILLICLRYLRDFPYPWSLIKVLILQFRENRTLSDTLLTFYEPARGGSSYLDNLERWHRFAWLGRLSNLWLRSIRVGVIIENEDQRGELEKLLLPPDAIYLAGKSERNKADYWIALKSTESLRFAAILLIKWRLWRSKTKISLLYTDHDFVSLNEEKVSIPPVFKPQPSRVYLHCFNYLGFATVFSAEMLDELCDEQYLEDDQKYRLSLLAFEDIQQVTSISEVLFKSTRRTEHGTPQPTSAVSPWQNIDWQSADGYNKLVANQKWKSAASVDLIIPTRDGMSVLKPCIESILEKTTHKNFSITIVDNGSEEDETLRFFETLQADSRVRVLSYPGEFNYSAINNFAVKQSGADYIVLVNNDIEVIEGDWLSQMLVWGEQEGVGVVGAKLLFSNGKVQHAGVTIGMGNAAGHIHRLEEGTAPGYQHRCLATQNMMAVTAACLLTPRSLFNSLGGLNERDFKVAYNDIDYCLRVEASGLQIIWTPEAVLYHHESVSRGDDMSNEHIERYFRELGAFQKKWKSKGFVDKFYSKHLRIGDEGVFPQIEHQIHDPVIDLLGNPISIT